jgi:hypothetical protein
VDERWTVTDEGRAAVDAAAPLQEAIPGTAPGPVAGPPGRRDAVGGRRGAAGGRVRHIA